MKDEYGEFKVSESSIERTGYSSWRIVHLLSSWAMGSAAQLSFFQFSLANEVALAALASVVLLVVLLMSYMARISLHDIFAQMGYREKFGVFMAVTLFILLPRLLGFEGWVIPLMLLIISSGLFAWDEIGFGRYYMACTFVILVKITTGPLISWPVLIFFFTFLLLTFWFDFIAFRLNDYGDGKQAPVPPMLFRFGWQTSVPILVFIISLIGFSFLFEGKTQVPVFDPGPVTGSNPTEFNNLSSIILDIIITVVIIVLLVVILNWFEKQLRRRKKPIAMEETLVDATEIDHYSRPETETDDLQIEEEDDARTRVLKRFALITDSMKKRGYDRYTGETSLEYMERIYLSLLKNPGTDSERDGIFQEACYSDHQVTEENAEQYMAYADSIQKEMEDEAHRLIEREVHLAKIRSDQHKKNG